jgi:hypothetical protein
MLAVGLAGITSVVGAQDREAQVYLLPLGSRASLVIDLEEEIPRAVSVPSGTDREVVVEIGPLKVPVSDALLHSESRLVRSVSVRSLSRDAGTVLRVEVTAAAAVSSALRPAGRRLYIDLSPVLASPSRPAVTTLAEARPQPQPQVPANARPREPELEPAPPAAEPVPQPAPSSRAVPDADAVVPSRPAAETLSSAAILRRAGVLAKNGDVDGLRQLQSDLAERPDRAELERVRLAVDEFLNRALLQRLAEEAKLLRTAAAGYEQLLQRLDSALNGIRTEASGAVEDPELLRLGGLVDALIGEVRAVQPPSESAEGHARLQQSLQALAASIRDVSLGVADAEEIAMAAERAVGVVSQLRVRR